MKVRGYAIESGADLCDANLRGANLQGAYLYGANLKGANLHVADLRDANLHIANLRDANLRDANLRGADLRGANLHGAYLYGADLRGANLYGADLRRANLHGAKGVLVFSLGMHFGFSYKREDTIYVQIGCEHHSLSHWLENGEQIGKKAGYSLDQIAVYQAQLNMIAVLKHRKLV